MLFADANPEDFVFAETVVGKLGGGAKRGKFGHAEKMISWVTENGLDQPVFTNVGRWRKHEGGSYGTPVYVPWWTIDLDGEDPVKVYEDAMTILDIMDVEGYDMRRIVVSFSGCKGFHVQVHASQFGNPVFASTEAGQSVIKAWTEDLSDGVDFDQSVTSPHSLIRVAGSEHEDTGIKKRPWSAEVFQNKSFRRLMDNLGPLKPFTFDGDGDMVLGARRHLESILDVAKEKYQHKKTLDENGDGDGIIATLKPGLVEGQIFGDKHFHVGRENGAYILGCWYLERYSERMAWARMESWNRRNDPPLPRHRLKTQFSGAKRTIYDERR